MDERLLETLGWEVTPEFRERYLTDAWTYNLTNVMISMQAEIDNLSVANRTLTEFRDYWRDRYYGLLRGDEIVGGD
jgi:hypothetical protein